MYTHAQVMSERLKEQQEMERKLAKAAKQLDHFERARREAEVPLLNLAYEARIAEDKAMHEEQQAAFAKAHYAAWQVDVQEKARLATMSADKAAFAAAVMARREGEFKALQQQAERMKVGRAPLLVPS